MSKSKTTSQYRWEANHKLSLLAGYSTEPGSKIAARINKKLLKAGPVHPSTWLQELSKVKCTCGHCVKGVWSRGLENGRPVNPGPCYRCQGTGKITLRDAYRSQAAQVHAAMRTI